MQIFKKPGMIKRPARQMNVAAYARVSSGKDEQLHSLAAQIDYYRRQITNNPNWKFEGVYADSDVPGTTSQRREFELLLTRCRRGEIDIILTKSISRFARNTVDLLNIVRELKQLDVSIRFERERIDTLSADGELMLTLLASFAQEESRSVSENMKWSIRNGYQRGSLMQIRRTYGYLVVKGMITVIPAEAQVIREIFEAYASGVKPKDICNNLNLKDVPTLSGSPWTRSRLNQILSNRFYTGSAILQKLHVPNHLTKKQERNEGQLPKYVVENSHEAIVSEGLFEKVKSIRQSRHVKPRQQDVSSWLGTVVCGICGENYHKRFTRDQYKWICRTYKNKGVRFCQSKQVPDEVLEELISQLRSESIFVSNKKVIDSIVVQKGNRIDFHLADGSRIRKEWHDRSRSESWTKEMRQACGKKTKERWVKIHGQSEGDPSKKTSKSTDD